MRLCKLSSRAHACFNGVAGLPGSATDGPAWYRGPLVLLPGLLCLLIGIALPSSGMYYRSTILLLWLPTLYLLVIRRHEWWSWFSPLMVAATLFFAWALLSSLWSNGDEPAREIKHALMIYLTLCAGVLAAGLERRWLICLLTVSCYFMACFAAISLYVAYVLHNVPATFRVASFWQMSHPILAAHVFGFFLMALLHMRPARMAHQACWSLALLLLAGFILLTQSRGVWMALSAGLIVTAALRRERIYLFAMLAGATLLSLVLAFWPDLLTGRGMSLRPELAAEGLALLGHHPLGGFGLGGQYSLQLETTGRHFDHPHNLFLSVGLDLGGVGLVLWLAVWALLLQAGWRNRQSALGSTVLGVWCFATVSFLSDGAGIWSKPREIWFLTWIPLTLALALGSAKTRSQTLPRR